MDIISQILPQLVSADEQTLYKILRFVGRKNRRKFISFLKDAISGKSGLLNIQDKTLKAEIKKKFENIINHYEK